MKLSIIMCLYNTSRPFLQESIESIERSTLKKEDYELIIIDDGSEIDYTDILKQYTTDEDKKFLINLRYVKTENRGILAARMYGISLACGKYICFVDSDDLVSINYHSPMIDTATEENADIILNDFGIISDNLKYVPDDKSTKGVLTIRGKEIFGEYISKGCTNINYFALWNKIYRRELLLNVSREIIKSNIYRFGKISFGDDILINYFAFQYAKKIINIHEGLYFYRNHNFKPFSIYKADDLSEFVKMISLVLDTMKTNLEKINVNGIEEYIVEWKKFYINELYKFAKSMHFDKVVSYMASNFADSCKSNSVKYHNKSKKYVLLHKNFSDIDEALSRVMRVDFTYLKVNYDTKDEYVSDCLDYISKVENKAIIYGKDSKLIIPKKEKSFFDRTFKKIEVNNIATSLIIS